MSIHERDNSKQRDAEQAAGALAVAEQEIESMADAMALATAGPAEEERR